MGALFRLFFGDHLDPSDQLDEIFGPGNFRLTAFHWSRHALEGARVDPQQERVRAMRALRSAEPRLSRKSARYLVDNLR